MYSTDNVIMIVNSKHFISIVYFTIHVQVAVMQFFACITNKGCCIKGCRDPYLYFWCRVQRTAYVWRTQTDREDTFEKLTIPFTHLIAVSLVECLILSAFTCLLCCEKCHKYRKDKRRRVLNQIQPEMQLIENATDTQLRKCAT